MNSVDMMHNLIYRAKNLVEFTVTTTVPSEFKFNGFIPFDIKINGNEIEAKVWAVDFNEAVKRFDEFLETCK